MNQTIIITHNGIHFGQSGNKNQAVRVVPADFVVGVIGGIAAGGIMHDRHAAKLI